MRGRTGTKRSRKLRLRPSGVISVRIRKTKKQSRVYDYVDKARHFNDLGNSLLDRFELHGELADLERAIGMLEQAVFLAPDGQASKPKYLRDFGNSLLGRFDRLEELADLDRAIESQETAVLLSPDGHTDNPIYLSNLGTSLVDRFERLGELADIDKAIQVQERAVSLTPDDDLEKPDYLTDLGISLERRFQRSGHLSDIDRAVEMQGRAVSLTPDDVPDKPYYLKNLGVSLFYRFERFGELAVLNRAIEMQERAVSLTPDGHPDKPMYLSNLGNSLDSRFGRLEELVDIDKAIETKEQAVHLTPDDHPNKPILLCNLGISFRSRYRLLGERVDIDGAVDAFMMAATSYTGSPAVRLSAAHDWIHLADNWENALPAYRVFMDLLPQVIWLGSSIRRRYQDIRDYIRESVINRAASTAITAQNPELATEWLEQGRSIIWGQLLNLRTPLDDLRVVDESLASELEELSRQLETAGLGEHQNGKNGARATSLEYEAAAHRRVAEEYRQLLSQIRKKSGFEHFLSPRPFSSLCEAASSDPVVLINVSPERCDAIVIFASNPPKVIHLTDFSQEKAEALSSKLQSGLKFGNIRDPLSVSHAETARLSMNSQPESTAAETSGQPSRLTIVLGQDGIETPLEDTLYEILSALWLMVVEPILAALRYLQPNTTGDLPHIAWCPSGPLVFLPLHAAGIYSIDGPRLHDYAVSTYIPSLSSILPSSFNPEKPKFTGVLGVSQPQGLPQTEVEIQNIQKCFGEGSVTWLNRENATADAVLEQMQSHTWVHFACHAKQYPGDPTSSYFDLYRGNLELSRLMQQRFNGEFAFLSACETALGDEALPEESVHLAAGMMMAGYPSVIGTMWSIRDDAAPIVAEQVYSHLNRNGKPDIREASTALHNAVAHLRMKNEQEFSTWVPFIHIGS